MAWNSTVSQGVLFIGISRSTLVLSWFLINSRTDERQCVHTASCAEGKVPEGGGRSKLEKLRCGDGPTVEKMLKLLEVGPSFCFRWKLMRCLRSPEMEITLPSDIPGGSADKESAWDVENLGSIPVLGRPPGEGNSYPFQYPGLEKTWTV